jgi:oligopeptidase B
MQSPPVAHRDPVVTELHGERRVDDYAWMHDDIERLRDYLEAERQFYDSRMAHFNDLRQTLFEEMARRLAPTDQSVSWPHGKWLYYTRTTSGKQYEDFCRRPAGGGDEQVVLSGNTLGEGLDYFALGIREISPDDRLLAYSVDATGDEVYELRVRDLEAEADLPDVARRSYYGFAWAADCSGFLYVVHDEAYRPYQVKLHRLGTDAASDVLVIEEPDERFDVTVSATRSGELAVIDIVSRDTSEVWLIPTANLGQPPRLVEARRRGIEYSVDHVRGPDGGSLMIVTNDGADEFRLMRAPVNSPGRASWAEVTPPRPGERLRAADAFAGGVVLTLRRDGLPALRVLDLSSGRSHEIDADPTLSILLSSRDDDHTPVRDPYDAAAVTVVTDGIADPPAWWAADLATGERTLLRRLDVPGFDAADYVSERLVATAEDGAQIPVTVVRRRGDGDRPMPLLLYGYGAYEECSDPWFTLRVASLLDRGVGYAIAHVRGGGERGREWWQQGRLHAKPNTFDDFVAAADMLAGLDWVDGDRIASRGVSAGGLLQGAAFSRAPHRWRAMIAEVPFVDVVTTMLDPSIPLTVTEWDEWGDPRDPADYAVMRGYSPYENVPACPRPALLVTGSFHDPRVMIREPAKWVARLRATQTDDSVLLFRPELGAAAHGGASGRLDKLRYEAEVLAFLLDALQAD